MPCWKFIQFTNDDTLYKELASSYDLNVNAAECIIGKKNDVIIIATRYMVPASDTEGIPAFSVVTNRKVDPTFTYTFVSENQSQLYGLVRPILEGKKIEQGSTKLERF